MNVGAHQKLFQLTYQATIAQLSLTITRLPTQDAGIHFVDFIPMIIKHSRICGNMKGHHPLIPTFNTLNLYPRSFADSDITILLQISLSVPFKYVCEEGP